jgi:Fur family ferric uptake transcriptional regulator
MIKDSKLRNTQQLSTILGVLKTSRRPISAAKLLSAAQKKAPSLNKTTVYRTLEKLVKDKTVEAIMLQEGILHYELRSHDENHHHHFVCSRCSKIYCINGCLSDLGVLLPKGFSLESHELTLRGVCKSCH